MNIIDVVLIVIAWIFLGPLSALIIYPPEE
jgi:hypothetical protein